MILLSDASDKTGERWKRGRGRGVTKSGHPPRGNAPISNSAA